jgi:hypothetical protein
MTVFPAVFPVLRMITETGMFMDIQDECDTL